MALDLATLRLAVKIDRRFERDYIEYLEECEEDHRRGHRAHYCEHGMNMWTDYDNICSSCEEGLTMGDAVHRRRTALNAAKRTMTQLHEIFAAYNVFAKHNLSNCVDMPMLMNQLKKIEHAWDADC